MYRFVGVAATAVAAAVIAATEVYIQHRKSIVRVHTLKSVVTKMILSLPGD